MTEKPLTERRFLKTEAVMRLFGYSDRAAFLVAVHSAGIPYVRINARRFLFEESAINAWLESRTVGGVR